MKTTIVLVSLFFSFRAYSQSEILEPLTDELISQVAAQYEDTGDAISTRGSNPVPDTAECSKTTFVTNSGKKKTLNGVSFVTTVAKEIPTLSITSTA